MPGARLTVEQRRTIERCYRIGLSQGQIASIIGKSASTVSRELARSFSSPGSRSPRARTAPDAGRGYLRSYNAERAQAVAALRARRPKARRLDHPPLREKVWELLRADWSPEQIAAMLPVLFPHDQDMRVSHETIYQSLFIQTKGELKRELTAHLRSRRTRRKTQTGGAKRVTLGITDDLMIRARPAEVEDRAVPGHWEGDLLLGGTGKGTVMTLVERSSRFVLLAPMPGRHTADLARMSLAEMIATLPLSLRRSITWDRGSEMAQHARFKVETGLPIYFCDPQSPWQRGTNENTNGLLRQYWPKGADLSHLTMAECDDVALRLNTRPRKTLDWQTPGQALDRGLIATAL
ncbi:IS30 family transposase [Nocardioides sp. cx-173]|uniref:IS30 family transposase n=1 Tax=Nocardioides sp. cx-173 TaxID=2898796 RepID=UPI001E44F460|nr:IS30 family transposase [Nocardioides sp. cx-173]UGB40990.1 IS30 family transposase [Nocardioides sp. cx-173]